MLILIIEDIVGLLEVTELSILVSVDMGGGVVQK